MIQLIIGEKGKGKTKVLLDNANKAITEANGNIVYLDKSSQNMYELNNKIRLINVSEFKIDNADQFFGFIAGIISQDHDLEIMYLDNFLVNAKLDASEADKAASKLIEMSDTFNVKFVVSMSITPDQVPDSLKDSIIATL